jgi:peptidoglycan-associated lipoprotein
MRESRALVLTTAATVALMAFASGCAKKKVAAATPAPPQPAQEQPVQRAAATPAPTRPNTTEPGRPQQRAAFPDAATRARIDQLLARIEDAYFDYDQHTLRPDAIRTLEGDSRELRDILKDYPDYKLTIEGHCDERGSAEYNLALGQKRAEAAKKYLVDVGIPGQQLATVSYGKEKPACGDHDENCWQKNRRIHIVAMATP